MRWASLAVVFEPKPAFLAVVQARDADAAGALRKILRDALDLLVREMQRDPAMGELAEAFKAVRPEAAEGDRIILAADPEKTVALASVPLRRARGAARRSQCANHLKQIGLAMHNYHSAHGAFPGAYGADKGGKPLLSWRVHILPFLDEKTLYDEFHLDEPWDGAHNKALISRMPRIYACPAEAPSLAGAGKTTYLTPRGPGTAFPGAQGVKINDITDGTATTLLVVDAPDDAAVTWTRPDDWEVDPEPARLFGHHRGGTNVGFADGSVRFLKDSIPREVLRALTTRKGGEPVNFNQF